MKWLGDTPVEAISQSMHAGLDLECGWYYSIHGVEASKKGMISEREIDKVLSSVLMRLGYFDGIPCKYVSPKDGLSTFGNLTYEKGCADVACKNDSFIFSAMEAAKKADATVVVVGLDLSIEVEFVDRLDLLLPGYQTQLMN
uniref:Uncharacterized protein n=1 Tax=Nelumbo nucifera TaxID=4432 RepID=A0A822XKB1_NELNU|nr:TPA_asm: hypothetical protein HUJ06_020849 [Nelumbo nucifera]